MNVKKLCRRGNDTNQEEDHSVIHLSRTQCLPLSFLSGSAPGNVRWCPSLALGSLFKTISDPQSVTAASDLSGPHFSALPAFHQPTVQEWFLNDPKWLSVPSPSASRGFSGVMGRVGTLGHPLGALFSLQGRWWEHFPTFSPQLWSVPASFQLCMVSAELVVYFLWGAKLCKRGSSFLIL